MGQRTDEGQRILDEVRRQVHWQIARNRERMGLPEHSAERQRILDELKGLAHQLIEVLVLEESGIRDGDGQWYGQRYGSDKLAGTLWELERLRKAWEASPWA